MTKRISFLLIFVLVISLLFGCGNDDSEEWAEMMAAYRAGKIEGYKEENKLYSPYEVDVVFLGDSLTDGYDVQKYYPDCLCLNRGIGGETTIGLEERLGVSVYDVKPKVAVMLIGINNVDTMFTNYENILKGFEENLGSTEIILLSLTSMSGEWGKRNHIAAYSNVRIKMLAQKYGYRFVDLYSPLMNPETGEIYGEYTTDGGHLTAAGYEVLTREITPMVKAALADWDSKSNA